MKQFLSTLLFSAVFLFAQSGFSINSSGIHVPGARTLSPGDLFVMGGFEMANSSKPASIEGFLTDENGKKYELTKDSPSNSVLGYVGYGILDYLEIGLNLNVHYDGNAGNTKLKGLGFGDIGLLAKVQLPNQSLFSSLPEQMKRGYAQGTFGTFTKTNCPTPILHLISSPPQHCT